MARNRININIQVRKTVNGYLVSGDYIRQQHDGNSNEKHVSTKKDAKALANEAFEHELDKF